MPTLLSCLVNIMVEVLATAFKQGKGGKLLQIRKGEVNSHYLQEALHYTQSTLKFCQNTELGNKFSKVAGRKFHIQKFCFISTHRPLTNRVRNKEKNPTYKCIRKNKTFQNESVSGGERPDYRKPQHMNESEDNKPMERYSLLVDWKS